MPSERQMFENFFSQIELADELEFKTAWVAETHLSCQVQKQNPMAVIPDFSGEIGLNTDILQLAHLVFARTKKINVGSAIRNILCNGGPVAHAEGVKTFLSFHSLHHNEDRKLELGFASGRFPFSTRPYGVRPRNRTEEVAWPILKNRIFLQATEIFLRLLKGETLSIEDVTPLELKKSLFPDSGIWEEILNTYKKESAVKETVTSLKIPSLWSFEKLGVIPFEAPLEYLRLTIGAHWTEAHEVANLYMPCGVFNLSITPPEVIEATHLRMKEIYHKQGGPWHRSLMPRTVLVFLSDDPKKSVKENDEVARGKAFDANQTYWKAIQGTIDPVKLARAVDNALVGHPQTIIGQIRERFHPEDRLMLWFDFNNHNNQEVCFSMKRFMEKVASQFQ